MPKSTHDPMNQPHAGRILGSVMLATLILASTGCYRHVVGTKNTPGYTGPVYEANVEEGNEGLFKTKTVTKTRTYYVD